MDWSCRKCRYFKRMKPEYLMGVNLSAGGCCVKECCIKQQRKLRKDKKTVGRKG